jgi:putative ABC transport system permease protein
MEPDELSFIVLGLVDVLAGVLILTSAAPLLVSRLGKSKILTRKWGPVLPVSLAYPLSTPVRTAVVMGMFSITVFSVIVLGGYAEQFDNYTSSFVEEAEGDYELLLTGSRASPIVLSSNVSDWNLTSDVAEQIDSIARIHRGEVFLEDDTGERMPYVVRGFDENFSQHGGLPLFTWDSSLGDDESEVWKAIELRNDLVLLDASFGLESIADGSGISMLSFSIGDSISLIDISNPGNTRNVQVAGFLEQSSYLFSAGVWMNDDVVIEQFDGRLTRMYVSISDDAEPSQSFVDEQVSDFSPTGKSRDVRLAAAELESELTPALNSKGVQVSVISDEVMLIQSLVLALLGIFEGYLALGLIVGIAGIGVVTVRSVSERSKSIGILRALGYRKNMVFLSFFIEVSWVSVLGMMNGILVAIGFHRVLYTSFWKEQGASFTLPLESIVYVFIGGWLLVLLATYAPIQRAARIPASAALRQN